MLLDQVEAEECSRNGQIQDRILKAKATGLANRLDVE